MDKGRSPDGAGVRPQIGSVEWSPQAFADVVQPGRKQNFARRARVRGRLLLSEPRRYRNERMDVNSVTTRQRSTSSG